MRPSASRGAALVAVLLAMSITSALVVGGAYVARQLASATTVQSRGAALEPFAEAAVVSALVSWDSAARAAQVVGETEQLPLTVGGRIQTVTTVTRVGALSWWLVADARDMAKPLLQRRLGVVVTIRDGRFRPIESRAWIELP